MANYDGPEKPISEVLKIAFEALKRHEKHMDKITTKLEQNKDKLTTGTRKLNHNLDEILQKLNATEQEIKKISNLLQT